MRIRDLSIRVKLFSLLGVYALGFAVVITVLSEKAKLERASYTSVVVMKDLVADVLPPPKYIIEPYLTLLQLSYETDPVQRAELLKGWDELKKAFEERQTYWQDHLPEGALKQGLEHDSTTSAREFFAIADKEFLPAARTSDTAKMHALLTGSLHDTYQKHRAVINEVVSLANKQSDTYIADAEETIASRKIQLLFLGSAIVGVCVLFGWLVSRNISRRLKATVEALDAVAAGDLTLRLDDDSRDDLGQMSKALNAAIDSMSTALGEVQTMSHTLTGAASELSASAESIASGAHEQAASLEETAASLEEITATVRQSSDNAQTANQLAVGSRQNAERGGTVVTQANGAMTEIHESSEKIGNIITAIDEIAFQTNILALNAAVEAARAGEQGRGFAVVAAQIGTLAHRSSEAAKEIKGLIQDSGRKVNAGAALVSRSGQSLQEIVKSVTAVTDLVSEMAAAFREQSTGLEQISTAVAQMDEVMHANSSQTEALSTTASSLTGHAAHLRDLLARFRLEASSAPAPDKLASPEPTRGKPAAKAPPARFRRGAAPRVEHPRAGRMQTQPAAPAPASREPARAPIVVASPAKPTSPEPDDGLAAMDEAMTAAALSNGKHEGDERGFEEV